MKKFMNLVIVFMGLLLISNNSMSMTFDQKVAAAKSLADLKAAAPDAYNADQQKAIEDKAKALGITQLGSLRQIRALYGSGGKGGTQQTAPPQPVLRDITMAPGYNQLAERTNGKNAGQLQAMKNQLTQLLTVDPTVYNVPGNWAQTVNAKITQVDTAIAALGGGGPGPAPAPDEDAIVKLAQDIGKTRQEIVNAVGTINLKAATQQAIVQGVGNAKVAP